MTAETAVVAGASSGIGVLLARDLAHRGSTPGLTARRQQRIEAIAEDLPTPASVARMDVMELEAAREAFRDLAAGDAFRGFRGPA